MPVTSTNHFVTVRGISEENIDFEYFFLVEAKVGRKPKSITSKSPVKGKSVSPLDKSAVIDYYFQHRF